MFFQKVEQNYKFMVFKLLENVFTCQRDESRHFQLSPNSYHHPSGREEFLIHPRQQFLENLILPAERENCKNFTA